MCHIDDRPPKLHFENFNIDYPLDLLCCEKYKCIFKFSQRDYRYSMNTKFTVRRTNTYTHTYIHTYIQTPLAFNTLMWGSLRLAPIITMFVPFTLFHVDRHLKRLNNHSQYSVAQIGSDCTTIDLRASVFLKFSPYLVWASPAPLRFAQNIEQASPPDQKHLPTPLHDTYRKWWWSESFS